MLLNRLLPSTLAAIALLGATLPAPSQASIVIGGTRVVYQAKDAERTIKITNKGKTPSLVQSWLDTGAVQADRGTLEVPFIVSPPISRIDPEKSQTLRILYSGEPLPTDRESLFWLNVLEVPPRPDKDAGDNTLQLAFRTRIKFFFRPAELSGSAVDAPGKVVWRLTRQSDGQALEASNPTPYHVNFTAVELATGDGWGPVQQAEMLAPFETRSFPLARGAAAPGVTQLRYQFINDHGGVTAGEARLQPAAR